MSKISVIIPVYNAKEYLSQCLKSVLGQKETIEVICVDDGSIDGSKDILNEFAKQDSRVKTLSTKNLGAGGARNKGIQAATGEYIHFLDADDYVTENAYKNILNIIEEKNFPEIIRFKAQALDIKTGNISCDKYFSLEDFIPNRFFEDLVEKLRLCVTPWGGFIRRDFLNKNKLKFNNLKCCNDRSFYAESVLLTQSLYVSDTVVVIHRVNNDNSLVGIRDKHFDCHFKSIKIIEKFCKENNFDDFTTATTMAIEIADLLSHYNKYIGKSKYSSKIYFQTVRFLKSPHLKKYHNEMKKRPYWPLAKKIIDLKTIEFFKQYLEYIINC